MHNQKSIFNQTDQRTIEQKLTQKEPLDVQQQRMEKPNAGCGFTNFKKVQSTVAATRAISFVGPGVAVLIPQDQKPKMEDEVQHKAGGQPSYLPSIDEPQPSIIKPSSVDTENVANTSISTIKGLFSIMEGAQICSISQQNLQSDKVQLTMYLRQLISENEQIQKRIQSHMRKVEELSQRIGLVMKVLREIEQRKRI